MPESAAYRKNVDEIVKNRLSVINTVSTTPYAFILDQLSSVGGFLIARLWVRISTGAQCCVIEQDTSSSLLSTGSTQENVPT